MTILEDNYYSDEEWEEVIYQQDSFIILNNKHSVPTFEKVNNQNQYLEKSNELILEDKERVVQGIFEKLKDFTKENSLELLDKCSLHKFIDFF